MNANCLVSGTYEKFMAGLLAPSNGIEVLASTPYLWDNRTSANRPETVTLDTAAGTYQWWVSWQDNILPKGCALAVDIRFSFRT